MLCSTSKRSSHRCVTTAQREEHHFVIIIDLLHLYFFWPQIWLGRCTQWLYDRVTLATLPVSGISWWREGKWGGGVWVDGIGEWTRKLLQQNSCCIEVKPCRLDHCQQPAKERERNGTSTKKNKTTAAAASKSQSSAAAAASKWCFRHPHT